MGADPMKELTPSKALCGARLRNGGSCRKSPMLGTNRCRLHGGAAPQTQKKARERLLAAADPLMAMLLKIAMSSDNEVVRLRATMDALDRAGLTERGVATAGISQTFDDVLAGIIDDAVVVGDEPAEPQALTAPGRRALPAAPPPGVGDEDYGDPQPHEPEQAMTREEMDRVASGAGSPYAPQGGSAHDPSWSDTYADNDAQVVQGEIVEGSVDPPAWVQERLEARNPNRVPPGYADFSR